MGGAQYQVKCMIEALLKRGEYDIFFLTKQVGNGFRPDGYKIVRIPTLPFAPFHRSYFDALGVMNRLKSIRPDIIYQRVGCAYTGFAAWYSAKSGCRSVWHIAHDNDVMPLDGNEMCIALDRLDKSLLEYGLRRVGGIIAQTADQSALLTQNYSRKANAVICNFHPFPTERLEKGPRVKIVWVANFKPWKQPDLFVRLAADLQLLGKDVECIMIGTPWDDAQKQLQFERDTKELKNFSFLGKQSIESVNAVLAESDIFVNTSLVEGFANTFIQAWMRKVPVVSLHCNPDGVFDKQQVGYFAGDYKNMLARIVALLDNRNLRRQLGENAQHHAFTYHSIKNVDHIQQVLEG